MPRKSAYRELLKVLDNLDAIVYVADMQTYEVLYVNKFVKNAFGDVTGQTCWKALQADKSEPCEFCSNKNLLDKDGKPLEESYRWEFQNTANGHWYDIHDRAIEWVDGRIVRLEIASDVTERKLRETELERDRKLLELIAQTQLNFIKETSTKEVFEKLLNDFLSLMDSEYGFIGEVLYSEEGKPYLRTHAITNIAWDDDTRKFYADNEEKGFEFFNLNTLFGKVMQNKEAIISNDPYNDPRRGGLPEGHPALNSFLGLPFMLDGQIVGMVGIANRPDGYSDEIVKYLAPFATVCANIIESYKIEQKRKETEAALQQTLDDKDILMREVHHRVKNNLAVIQSLLRLQLKDITDDKSKEYFHDAENRVKSMTMIHEMLHKAADITKLSTSDYIQRFVETLFYNYKIQANHISLEYDIQNIELDVDTMIPLGLIINELVSNALKYAFPDEMKGELIISLKKQEEVGYELIINDTGVGLPEDFDIKKITSLGLQIVNSLVTQINGTLEVSNKDGATFRVLFAERPLESV